MDLDWGLWHDYFNLIVLPFVCACNIFYLVVDHTAYLQQYRFFLAYLLFDTVWIVCIPSSVASPVTITLHHIICIIGWNIPVMCEYKYSYLLSLGALVEVNTWLLIARRNFSRKVGC